MQTQGVAVFDIRPDRERVLGTIEGARPLDSGGLAASLREAGLSETHECLLCCTSGVRSLKLAGQLRERGYVNVRSIQGGFRAWQAAGLPSAFPEGFEPREVERYARHLVLPEIGPEGQTRLRQSRVLLVGAGGLGSPAALYLAAAGVGRLGLIDHDRVERSNLQRQLLHVDSSVGALKVESAAERLKALNPDIEVVGIAQRLTAANVEHTIKGWDLIIDGADNFTTRYLLNDACAQLSLPLVYGAVMGFEGQVSVFHPGAGRGVNPCYRCLFPEPPSAEDAPDCNIAGILGVVPGLIGVLQATEALKILLQVGEPLIAQLLLVDALNMQFRKIRLKPDPHCRLCAPGAEFPGFSDYDAFCAA